MLPKPAEVPRLRLSSGFLWDVGLDSLTPALPPRGESSDSEEDEKPHQAMVLFSMTVSFIREPSDLGPALSWWAGVGNGTQAQPGIL